MAKQKNDFTIVQFDPDDFYITLVDLVIDKWGLKHGGGAHNLHTSEQLVEKIQRKEIIPDIAIVEAHMGKSEYDGQKIAEKLKELVPGIQIIGFSTYETAQWADVEAQKSLRDPEATIIRALSELTNLEYEISNVKDPSD